MREQDREQVLTIARQSFNMSQPFVERMREQPVDPYRVAVEDGRVVASAAAWPYAHFFGGSSIPSAGISGVVVAPYARGRRLAETLVGAVLREARGTFPVSTLYPATVPIYRRLGYEYAATRCTFRIPMNALQRFPGDVMVQPWDDADLGDVATAQRAYASGFTGTMDRVPGYWDRLLRPMGDDPVYRVLVREDGVVTGSMIYTQENGFHMDLVSRDIFWRTPDAARALLSYVSRHHSLGREFSWIGRPADPMLFFTAEDKMKEEERWQMMLRIVDVPAALAQRGYMPGVQATVAFAVEDDLFPENRGPWRIDVAGGKGAVEPADAAEITISARTLASIFSGFVGPHEARRAGMLDGPDGPLDRLAAVFAGPAPWTADFF